MSQLDQMSFQTTSRHGHNQPDLQDTEDDHNGFHESLDDGVCFCCSVRWTAAILKKKTHLAGDVNSVPVSGPSKLLLWFRWPQPIMTCQSKLVINPRTILPGLGSTGISRFFRQQKIQIQACHFLGIFSISAKKKRISHKLAECIFTFNVEALPRITMAVTTRLWTQV